MSHPPFYLSFPAFFRQFLGPIVGGALVYGVGFRWMTGVRLVPVISENTPIGMNFSKQWMYFRELWDFLKIWPPNMQLVQPCFWHLKLSSNIYLYDTHADSLQKTSSLRLHVSHGRLWVTCARLDTESYKYKIFLLCYYRPYYTLWSIRIE